MKIFLAVLCAAAVAAGCINAREGSTVVYVPAHGTNNAAPVITAAANGANAQHAGNRSELGAKGSASMQFASKWWLWLVVGIVLVLIGWAVWKFVFTGAKIGLIG